MTLSAGTGTRLSCTPACQTSTNQSFLPMDACSLSRRQPNRCNFLGSLPQLRTAETFCSDFFRRILAGSHNQVLLVVLGMGKAWFFCSISQHILHVCLQHRHPVLCCITSW